MRKSFWEYSAGTGEDTCMIPCFHSWDKHHREEWILICEMSSWFSRSQYAQRLHVIAPWYIYSKLSFWYHRFCCHLPYEIFGHKCRLFIPFILIWWHCDVFFFSFPHTYWHTSHLLVAQLRISKCFESAKQVIYLVEHTGGDRIKYEMILCHSSQTVLWCRK